LNLPDVIGSDQAPNSIVCDALAVGAFSDREGPVLPTEVFNDDLKGAVSGALSDAGFKGKVGEAVVVPTLGRGAARAVVVAGLGHRSDASPSEVRRAAAAAARQLPHRREVVLALHRNIGGSETAAIEGFLLGSYKFDGHKSEHVPQTFQRVIVPGSSDDGVTRAIALVGATVLARDLVNEPASVLTPTALGSRAREVADASGLACELLDEKELSAGGFGGILGVGRGSAEPPRLIRLHYRPASAAGKVALVGKGVTYDSGGLSLKDPRSMEAMKTDMSGGAAVIAAMSALPTLRPNVEVMGFVPAVENLPSGSSIKPGDLITHYGGRTTEVLNTDAEGRLILADTLVYASEQKPDAIVDVATLTGAISIALGKKLAGLFTNDDSLKQEILEASGAAGEQYWPMPLFSTYKNELESDVADSKNIGVRYGSAIMAALFLSEFVGKGIAWGHLDIAGTARADSSYDEISKGGTGAATRTLIHWVEGRAR
jgi:leucyl aminopeptidase